MALSVRASGSKPAAPRGRTPISRAITSEQACAQESLDQHTGRSFSHELSKNLCKNWRLLMSRQANGKVLTGLWIGLSAASRGDWIRTSDLLNPILTVHAAKVVESLTIPA